jgi:flagellar protein FliS
MGKTKHSIATSYQRSQVHHADPVQLIVLLYDGALMRLAEAKQRFGERNYLQGQLAVTKAQAIVNELLKSLNLEEGKEVAANLLELYRYLHNLLVKAVLESRTDLLDEASRILSDLREAWGEVANQCKDLMEGVQAPPPTGATAYHAQSDSPRLMVKA